MSSYYDWLVSDFYVTSHHILQISYKHPVPLLFDVLFPLFFCVPNFHTVYLICWLFQFNPGARLFFLFLLFLLQLYSLLLCCL